MASCFYLLRQFDDAASYLGSIATYFEGDPVFHWNYGMALAAAGEHCLVRYQELEGQPEEQRDVKQRMQEFHQQAEGELLKLLESELSTEPEYVQGLGAVFIANRKAKAAWNLLQAYRRQDRGCSSQAFEEELQEVLEFLAPRFHQAGAFLFAARCFGSLEAKQDLGSFWEMLRASCVRLFEQEVDRVTSGACDPQSEGISGGTTPTSQLQPHHHSIKVLREVTRLLLQSSNPEAENIVRIIHEWADEEGLDLDSIITRGGSPSSTTSPRMPSSFVK